MADKNNNKANEEVKTEAQPVQTQETPVNAEPAPQQPATTEEQKTGFGGWLKKHWKGVVGGVTATAAAVGSAVVAYKKGKAAGVMSVPVQQTETDDYSLNPNE